MAYRNYFLVLFAISIFFVAVNVDESFAQEDGFVPDWTKQNAIWWGEGLISTQEYLDGISFLIEDEIIEVPGFVKTAEGQEFTPNSDIEGTEKNISDSENSVAGFEDFIETKLFEAKILEIVASNLYTRHNLHTLNLFNNGHEGELEVYCAEGDIPLQGWFVAADRFSPQTPLKIQSSTFGPITPHGHSDPVFVKDIAGMGLKYEVDRNTENSRQTVILSVLCLHLPEYFEHITTINLESELTWMQPEVFIKSNEEIETLIDPESDRDEDGIPYFLDNCPFDFNPDQKDSDGDGPRYGGDACDICVNDPGPDPDNDAYCTGENLKYPHRSYDNCPYVSNNFQEDTDGDGIGDACERADPLVPQRADPDSDGDGIYDTQDNCPNHLNRDQKDSDGDGIGDACDTNQTRGSLDSDGDGIADNVDQCPTSPEDKNGYKDTDGCPDGRGN